MEEMNSVVAVYATHPQAEEALRAFQSTGFDMKKLSIVGKDYHTEEHGVKVVQWARRSRERSRERSKSGARTRNRP